MIGIGPLVRAALAWLALSFSILAAPAMAQAPGLASRIEPLPPLRAEGATLLALGDRAVMLTPERAFLLDMRRKRWMPITRDLASARVPLEAMSGGGRAALIDRSAGAARGIEVASLTANTLRGHVLPLPTPLRSVRAAWEGDALLVAGIGGDGRPRLLRHRLSGPGGWEALPAWPQGAPAVLSAQNRARFVILGDGRQWRWRGADGWHAAAPAPGAIAGGAGAAIGQAHLLYAVAGRGVATLYSYSSITDAWAPIGPLPSARAGGITAAGDAVLVAGSDAGIVRGWRVGASQRRPGLAGIDVGIVAVYMLAMLGMGLYFYSRTNADSSAEFFLGNRRIPFWAAGLSMFAGTIGSVNYLAYPAKSFETDWQYLMSKLTYVGALVVVAIWLAPFFRRLNVVSVNTYLETRFHLGIRLLASGLWVILQLGARMGIILYLPALAINTMTGIDIVACIVTMGAFTIVYTALGGMKAVVWTDVVQVFVLIGGALFAIGYIFYDLGFANVVDTTIAFHKTRAINLSFDVRQPTIWTFVALAVLEGILCFPRDQIVMQRVLSTSTPREASWSILTFAAILMPSAILFYGIGTALFAFYRAHPADLDPLLPIDAVFPTFIGTQLPHGVVGLVVAGVLAAAMGVLSGIINSVATLLSVDFYARFLPDRSQKQIVRFSEIVSVAVGAIGICIAIILSRLNVHSLLDLTIELGGVFGGSFAGAFPLGMFSTRTNWQGAAIGIVASAIVTLTIWSMQLVHPYLYLAIAILVTLVVGYLGSLAFPAPNRSLEGLTVFTRARRAARSPA